MDTIYRYANPLALATVLLANAALGSGIGAASDRFSTRLTPGSPAFSIWLAIYTLLVVLCIRQWDDEALRAIIGPWFVANCVLSISWLVCFTSTTRVSDEGATPLLWLAAVSLLGMLVTAGAVLYRMWASRTFWGLSQIAMSLYVGWLAVASVLAVLIASRAPLARDIDRALTWSAVAACVGVTAVLQKDPVLALPLAWAAFWRWRDGEGDGANDSVAGVASIFATAFAALAALRIRYSAS